MSHAALQLRYCHSLLNRRNSNGCSTSPLVPLTVKAGTLGTLNKVILLRKIFPTRSPQYPATLSEIEVTQFGSILWNQQDFPSIFSPSLRRGPSPATPEGCEELVLLDHVNVDPLIEEPITRLVLDTKAAIPLQADFRIRTSSVAHYTYGSGGMFP